MLFFGLSSSHAQSFSASNERPPAVPREFRGAWSACVYNIDWPSRKGLSASSQQAEMKRILDRMVSLNMNALIFQVRPNADAVYQSSLEPWSSWISGTMGRSPGYDPLSYCIQQAHSRGIEVHAWFNPFRALPNSSMATASNHVTKTNPSVIRQFKNYSWMDPASAWTRSHALRVMMDVVKRYDIDGLHIDDYFYPYPDVGTDGVAKQIFPDGKSPAQRRGYVDNFVRDMYRTVKKEKPWVRVGISPFGIWRPGVPAGTTARIDAYHHLSADSRKWLSSGWCDYLSPQLYWRINSEQSFTRLLTWWRQQGSRQCLQRARSSASHALAKYKKAYCTTSESAGKRRRHFGKLGNDKRRIEICRSSSIWENLALHSRCFRWSHTGLSPSWRGSDCGYSSRPVWNSERSFCFERSIITENQD